MSGELGALLQMPRSDSPGQDGEAAPAAAPAAAPRMDEAPRQAGPAGEARAPRVEFRLSGDRMGGWRKAWGTAHHLFQMGRRRFSDARAQEGGMVAAALRWRGPSVEDQSAYATGRAWVPRGFAGGLLEAMGVIFHALIGRPGVALGNAIKGMCEKPWHFVPVLVAGSLAWWALHGLLGLPGGSLPVLAVLAVLGAWVAAGAVLNLMWEHRSAKPSPCTQAHHGDDGERYAGEADPDGYDDEDYLR